MSANKVIIYVTLIFLYLGLSKSLSPSELGISYVNNQKSLSEIVRGQPLSVILIDVHSTGFIIKTYYHKYRIVYGFQTYEELIVRVSRSFMQKNLDNIGLSLMSRNNEGELNFTPLPPGSVFIGDTRFGRWNKIKGSDELKWTFHHAYRFLPKYLGLKDFKITYKFFEEIGRSINDHKAFYGFNDEFGAKGDITKKSFPSFFTKKKANTDDLKEYMKNYLKKNFYTR
jgi:hypothetical protein